MKLILSGTLFLILGYLIPVITFAQYPDSIEYPLYISTIPNSKISHKEKVDHRLKGGRFVSKITNPTLSHFLPEISKNKAIVICPGGGYRGLAIDKEGFRVARLLANEGYHAFVLKYRCPDDSLQFAKNIAPIQDVQMAIIRVTEILNKMGVNEIPIGIMGFSAGGHLASMAANYRDDTLPEELNPDKINTNPEFSILIYPVISMKEEITHLGSRNNLLGTSPSADQINFYSSDQRVGPFSPPAFIVHAGDDVSVNVKNSINYYLACINHGIPVEMHIYAHGGHGFGLNNPATKDSWAERLFNWLLTF